MAANRQFKLPVLLIIGCDGDVFIYVSPAIPAGSNFDFNFSLAAGRDLSRVRDSRTPSVGMDLFDLKRCGSFVLNNEIMDDVGPVQNRLSVVMHLG